MDKRKENNFKWRPFISLVLFLSFGIMVFSGFALYMRPEGSLARWTSWKMLGIDKKGWEGIHTIFCLAFISGALLHLAFNLKPLLKYLSPAIDRNRRIKQEFVAAIGLVVSILIVALLRIPPASLVINWRSAIKNGSAVVRIQPPEPDFEKRSLKEISGYFGISFDQITGFLKGHGIIIQNSSDSLGKIARQNRMSPQNLFELILSGIP